MSKNDQGKLRDLDLFSPLLGVCALVIPLVISACGSAPGTPAPTVTFAPKQANLDACQLMPKEEASALAGTTFGDGKDQVTATGKSSCIYSVTSYLVMMEVFPEKDAATAKADGQQALQEVQSGTGGGDNDQPMNLTQLPNFADGGFLADFSGSDPSLTLSGIGMGFLSGTTYVYFAVEVQGGGSAPSSAAMQSEATQVLGRLP